jgi:hypothetical protein
MVVLGVAERVDAGRNFGCCARETSGLYFDPVDLVVLGESKLSM